jgi:hypothetical protein
MYSLAAGITSEENLSTLCRGISCGEQYDTRRVPPRCARINAAIPQLNREHSSPINEPDTRAFVVQLMAGNFDWQTKRHRRFRLNFLPCICPGTLQTANG